MSCPPHQVTPRLVRRADAITELLLLLLTTCRCLEGRYSESLPAASVIICFHDESWSTLLRTVHSVLDTAHEHLREILLVDDLSQHGGV